MFREMMVIVEKEMHRVFSDRRLLMTTFVVPFLSIFIMYSIMGTMLDRFVEDIETHTSQIYVYQSPESFKRILENESQNEEYEFKVTYIQDEKEVSVVKNKIKLGEIEALVVFDAQFDQTINRYQTSEKLPQIQTYYNPSEEYSSKARNGVLKEAFENYKNAILAQRLGGELQAQVFALDPLKDETQLFDEKKAAGKELGNLLPFLITLFLFSGAMSLGMETIAGEKERGTLATMLVTPIRRDSIAFGKILSLSILAMVSSLSSFAGILASMPFASKLLRGDSVSEGAQNAMALPFGALDYVMLLGVMVTMVLIFVAIVCVVSLYAKSMKEAGAYATPIYLVVMVIGILTMFSQEITPMWAYAIPVYGSIMSIKAIFMYEYSWMAFSLTIGVSCLTISALVFLCKTMFNNERIIFNQ